MTEIRIGCVGFVGPVSNYFKQLGTKELTEREEAAQLRALGRWRRDAPETAAFVPRVQMGVVEADFAGPEAEAAWVQTVARAEKLGADTVLLRTGAGFRPNAARVAAMIAFFNGREGPRVAWWAEGLWEDSEAFAAVCAATALVPVVDPLAMDDDETLPEGEFVYWRLMGRRGLQGRLSDYDLDVLLEKIEGHHGYVIFTAQTMMRDAKQFANLCGVGPEST